MNISVLEVRVVWRVGVSTVHVFYGRKAAEEFAYGVYLEYPVSVEITVVG